MKRKLIALALFCALLLTGCGKEPEAALSGGETGQPSNAENADLSGGEQSSLPPSDEQPAIELAGRYVDDLGSGYERSDMTITQQDSGAYDIEFGIYKLTFVNASLEYHSETNLWSFEGIDDNGNELAASISPEDSYLSVTLTKSAYSDMPEGTVRNYYPEGYYPVETH